MDFTSEIPANLDGVSPFLLVTGLFPSVFIFFPPLSDHLIKPYFHTAVAVFSPHPNPQFFTVVLRQGFILWARVLYIIQAALEFRVLVLLLPEVTVLG